MGALEAMTEFREILVLGLGRSGSNLLCSILRKIEGNAGYFEIFGRGKSEGLRDHPSVMSQMIARFAPGAQDATDAGFLAARNADPVAFFDALSKATRAEGHSSMTCKIFVRQISLEHLQAILARPNLSVIFLTRRRIDRYISGVKGQMTGRYVNTDSTEVRPALDLADFLRKAFETDRELDAFRDAVVASGNRYSSLTYERDLDVAEQMRTDRINAALNEIGFSSEVARAKADGWLVKQDLTLNWRDKVTNGFETAAALAGLGLLEYAEGIPLDDVLVPPRSKSALAAGPRKAELLDEGGYNLGISSHPAVTFTAIQNGRSYLAEWMAGPEPAFRAAQGVHFLKPTWTMETTDLRPLADTLRLAEVCNPGHSFVAMHLSDREAQKYREVGVQSIPGNPNLFTNEAPFLGDLPPHPGLPSRTAVYVARLAKWKNHMLAAGLDHPLFVYGNPVDPSERDEYEILQGRFSGECFVNHRLGQGKYHYLGRQELASVLSRAQVALALSREEGCMRASVEYLLAGLPVVSLPSIGGRELLFTSDTALIVEATPEAVRQGVEAMAARGLSRDEVRRATLARLGEARHRFLEAANRQIADRLGPFGPQLTMEPLLDFTIRYVPLRRMIEALQ
jgi:Glycosyl transferases group 1